MRRAMPAAWTVLAPLLSLVSSLAGCGDADSASPGAAQAAPEAREVSIVTVAPTPVAIEDVLPGRVAPRRAAEVRPQVGGIVRARLFEEGDTVEAGQPLYRIDPSVFRAEVAGAQATAERSRAALSFAASEAERTRVLTERGVGTAQSLEAAANARAMAEAELALSEATLQRNRLQLRYTTVTAPIGGRIGISRVSEGALVGPGDPLSLATIQQVDEVYVDLKQPASRYDDLRNAFAEGALLPEASLPVTLLSLQGEPYAVQGRLLFTDISVDPSTSELTLRVLVPNADLRLLPGMFVRARITFGHDPDALLVPQQAVRHDPSLGATVLVVDTGDVVAIRTVRVGRIIDGMQLVIEGLSAGDRVIVEGLDTLAVGAPVRPVPWSLPAATAPAP